MDNDNKLDRFLKLGKAGEGTYGVVYKAKNKLTGKNVALKKIKLQKFYNKGCSEGVPSTAMREITLLKGVRHSSIVELLDVMYTTDKLYLVFEYLDLDLKRYMDHSKQPLEAELVKNYMKQLLDAIAYLHSHRILHRDLKPQNLLVDKEGHIKMADFGLARSFSLPTRTYTHEVITMWYRAPELLLGEKMYCTGVDIWSLGCVMAEMLMKRALFPGDSEIDQLYKIFRIMGTPQEDDWPGVQLLPDFKAAFPKWLPKNLRDIVKFNNTEEEILLKEMLTYDPAKRKTAKELLKYNYLKTAKLTTPDLTAFPVEETIDEAGPS
ncbi:cyclin-dependent kinase 2-like [Anthonomus grandis grandis]|uniref:cyclin-dependent kinase 2-like n=1 Tax=Anthonomus grandis grandis TaxID=2921223 RepID=UPI0021651CCE|nr:cyclin-dependent kinase 2-like [Anthonomus grandis grandis]